MSQELDKAYALLGVSPQDSENVVKTAWRGLVRRYHPDQFASEQKQETNQLAEINAAFDAVVKAIKKAPRATKARVHRPSPEELAQKEAAVARARSTADVQARRKARVQATIKEARRAKAAKVDSTGSEGQDKSINRWTRFEPHVVRTVRKAPSVKPKTKPKTQTIRTTKVETPPPAQKVHVQPAPAQPPIEQGWVAKCSFKSARSDSQLNAARAGRGSQQQEAFWVSQCSFKSKRRKAVAPQSSSQASRSAETGFSVAQCVFQSSRTPANCNTYA